ncbi:MAG: hypothetical protein J7L54_04820 [Elusimicrobia bacterium]|nr:hypothetical protein [Elusimicrobiota bacterium]
MESHKIDELFSALKSVKAPCGFEEKVLDKINRAKKRIYSFALRISFALAAILLIFFAEYRRAPIYPSDILISDSEVAEMENSLIDDFFANEKYKLFP